MKISSRNKIASKLHEIIIQPSYVLTVNNISDSSVNKNMTNGKSISEGLSCYMASHFLCINTRVPTVIILVISVLRSFIFFKTHLC